MERYLLDARQSVRALRRQPRLMILAVTALALGVGFTTTMFSIVRGGVRQLPFVHPHQLVALTQTNPANGYMDLNTWPADYLAWADRLTSVQGLGAFRIASINLSDPGMPPERRSGAFVTANAFGLLGAKPAQGRGFQPADAVPGAPAVVLLGDAAWRARYGEDPAIVGRTIRVDGAPRTVIGVMPPRFGFPASAELWLPLQLDPAAVVPGEGERVQVFGRLKEGVALAQANTELASVAQRIASEQPRSHEGLSARVFPYVDLDMDPGTRRVLYLMLLAVSFVLLIACANVANLLLGQAAARGRDVAVRTALGASRGRILAQHFAESLVLALAGGALGLLIAQAGVAFFVRSTSSIIQAFWMTFRVDGTVLLFATGLVAAASVLAGMAPALQASRTAPAEVLKDAGQGAGMLRLGRWSRGLVVSEVALACGLLVVSALLIKSAAELRARSFPFPERQILTARVSLPETLLTDPDGRDRLVRALDAQLQASPGLEGATLAGAIPGRGAGNWRFRLDDRTYDRAGDMPITHVAGITPAFLATLGQDVLAGRNITWHDDERSAGVALVNQSFVRRFLADGDPLGRQVHLGRRAFTVVGVVPDLQIQDISQPAGDGVYLPMLQLHPTGLRIMVRTTGDPLALVGTLRAAVQAADPDLPLYEVATLRQAIYSDKRVLEAFGTLFLLFGVGALLLTAIGLYGVVAFAVGQRTREVGIRMALGARSRDILAMIMRQGLRQLLLGFGIGLALALTLARIMAAAMDFVKPFDIAVFSAVVAVLGTAGLAALVIPARRAARLQPSDALRQQ